VSHPFPNFLSKGFLNFASIDSFIIATFLLAVPILIVNSIGRFGRDLSDIARPAPLYYTVLILVATVVSSVTIWSTVVCGTNVNISNLIAGFAPYASPLGLVYYWKGEDVRKPLMLANFLLLALAPYWLIGFVRAVALIHQVPTASACPWFWP
jgi:hypothetical protein